jgi:dephospho-CoA kinase
MKKRKPNKRLVIGITGGFGTGKTTVSRMLKRCGARVVDADAISRRMLVPGKPAYRDVVRRFGEAILGRGRRIDRSKLGALVFSQPRQRRWLEAVLHPRITAEIKRAIKKHGRRLIVLDAPLLLEAGLRPLVDRLAVVAASEAAQIKRMRKKYALSAKEIRQRISAQMALADKIRVADFVIDNSQSLSRTRKQVAELRRKWWKS